MPYITPDSAVTTKIQGKFYPLQQQEWVQVCKELSSGARDILYYIRTGDPYGNGLEIKTINISKELCINRSTVTRALIELKTKGYINMEIFTAKVSITGKGLLSDAKLHQCETASASAEMHSLVQNCTNECKNAPTNAILHQTSAETLSQQGFQRSKNYKIKKTSKTLSESKNSNLEGEEEKINLSQENPEVSNESPQPPQSTPCQVQVLSSQPSISSLDKIRGYSLVVEKQIRELDWELIYDGENTPWLLSPRRKGDIYFHPKFMEWHGRRLMEKFSKPDIHAAIADFRSSLINQPSRIQGRWEEYEGHMGGVIESAVALVEAGSEPDEYTKTKITAHAELIAKCEPVKAMKLSSMPELKEVTENHAAYLPYKPAELPPEKDVPPTAAALTDSCKTAMGRRFVENLILKNPHWGYFMVDGVVMDEVW